MSVKKTSKIIGLICARGGSKGLPGKNLLHLGDRSLLAHAITIAKNVPIIDRVIVSTDCEKIAKEASEWGAEVPYLRQPELSTDKASEWNVWQDMISWLHSQNVLLEAMVMLSPTSPLRSLIDVENAIDLFHAKSCDGIISVTPANRNPMFNMVRITDDGDAKLAIIEKPPMHRRQDAPSYFDITTVCYVMKPDYVLSNNHIFDGTIKCNIVPRERSLDIDDAYDFFLAKTLLNYSKLSTLG